ncbi:hypothetical protein SXIM_19400 [Streptomyces xiamenensis]|uniref:Uncharacterized protein n=1 Tax=Streptomyces xiamenensis TaxID=408015 RepID=A0A0F7FT01_9ACTN|nr:hypothetical protein SXIM_19400 [Streptomyces xiamenensis]
MPSSGAHAPHPSPVRAPALRRRVCRGAGGRWGVLFFLSVWWFLLSGSGE